MKAESNIKPKRVALEHSGGEVTVILTTGVEMTTNDGAEAYKYKEYRLTTGDRPNLLESIEEAFDLWLESAIAKEYDELAEMTRQKRNALISATDWMVVADAPLSQVDKEKALIYRQALRDVPEQILFPYEVIWPKL